jgi:hypothetical protein
MSIPQCGRCGASVQGPAEYVLDGQRLCALCYGLALSAGSDRCARALGEEPLVRLDEGVLEGGDRKPSTAAADAPEPRPPTSPPEPVDRYATTASRRTASLMPAGVALALPARSRIDDDSTSLPAHRSRGQQAARDRWLLS